MVTIGIIGNGFVGKATNILKCNDITIIVYDINPELCVPLGTNLVDLCEKCDIIFISVPTPMNSDNSCYLDILNSVVDDISAICDLNQKIVVIRSTVPVGTTDNLNCYFMPEFLTEKNFEKDFINNRDWIFGCKGTKQDNIFKQSIVNLFETAYNSGRIKSNNINFTLNSEAEMIKLVRNNYLSTKISFFNEINEYCNINHINFEVIRNLVVKDERIGQSHSFVPGHDGRYGYGGTCFPKDTNSLLYEMNKSGMKSYIVNATVERNECVDRKEQDWRSNTGRAVVSKDKK